MDNIQGFTLEADKVYYAGFFDGEGHCNIRNNKAPNGKIYPILHVSIGQKNRKPLDYLASIFGGNIYLYEAKAFHQWSIVGTRAKKFLIQVRPYLKVRCDQVDTAMAAFQEHQTRMDENARLRSQTV